MKSCGADRRARPPPPRRVRVWAAERDVLAHRAREQEALLRHDPELAPQLLLRDVAQVVAVDRDPPSRGS